MIKELVQFVDSIPEIVKERAVNPKTGLHILLDFDDAGKGYVVGSERYLGKKHPETSQFLKECAARQETAWMIDTNKCFDLPEKGLHSASPFCIAFKITLLKSDKDNKNRSKNLRKASPSREYKQMIINLTTERLNKYFEKCFDPKFGLGEKDKQKTIQFSNYLKGHISELLQKSTQFDDIGWDNYVIIYRNESLEAYKSFQEAYLSEGIFNTADYNIEVEGEILGTSNFYNGFNNKKPFLTHHTASFDITYRIGTSHAKALSEFQIYAGKRLLPNPIPIFVDAPELTKEAIRLFHRSQEQRLSHREIISELWKRREDLGNYYLVYFSQGAIRDFDYVTKFRYLLGDKKDDQGETPFWIIENVTEIKNKEQTVCSAIRLRTVFDFELVVVKELFNNALVKVDDKNDAVSVRYFDDIDPKYYRAVLYSLILRYRKPIYDFIYKSERSGIRRQQFDDICMTGIFDDLRENKAYAIRSKLNIYFSLYQYFDKTNNQQIMPSNIEAHKAEIAKVAHEIDSHFATDEAYAFGAGQLIYFLLSKSEAGEPTHALLEPFLQKTNHANFNDAITALLSKYKHAISFDFKRFNTLAAEVLDYTPEKKLQDLRPFLLAGYFCPNILYTKRSDSPS